MADVTLFERVVVPVAGPEDAAATAAALTPYVDGDAGAVTVVAVHVVEKAGGAPDAASVEQRELDAEEAFEVVAEGLPDVELRTEIHYHADVAVGILEAAADLDATAVVFTPRGGSRWLKLLAGDVTTPLLDRSDRPVVVLPDRPEVDDA